jgi:Flp pilus assembly protein TadD
MLNIKKYLILIFVALLLTINSSVYSAEKSGGRDDFSYLKAKNSNLKKGHDALKQAKKYEKKLKTEKAKKRFNDAVNFFSLANEEFPNEPEILNYLGYTLKKTGDFMMAEIYYEQGLTIDSQHIDINKNIGKLYFETNRIKKAKGRLKILKSCMCEAYEELKNLIK